MVTLEDPAGRERMKASRIVALIIGCVLLLPGLAALLGGGGLGLAYAIGRDDDGYFAVTLDRFETSTAAITAEDLSFTAEPGSPDWVLDTLDADIRIRITGAPRDRAVFVGIARAADVNRYLRGVAHNRVTGLDGRAPEYRHIAGRRVVEAPTDQSFWVESAAGTGTRQLTWDLRSGRWAAVIMNSDGSPGVAADVQVGAKAGFILPLALIMLAVGALLTIAAVVLIVTSVRGHRRDQTPGPGVGATDATGAPIAHADQVPATARGPVSISARLDDDLSPWKWLVKWFLAIPHYVVLAFLWLAFAVLTVVAGFAILFTGVYPRGIFDFNVGVLRWSWRVSYYATSGGIGTDRYPPFTLGPAEDYPATLEIAYPERLSRGLVLVKWWLLAIPHYVIVGVLVGGSWGDSTGPSLLGILVVIAGVALLFTGRYLRGLFDLIIGLNRWILRVVAYAALMTDKYPPFRLDQGGIEPQPRSQDA